RFTGGVAYAFAQSPTTIPLFGTTLRGIGTIGVAAADPTPAPVTGVTHYTININQFTDQITPTGSGLGPTTLRGFNPTRLLAGQNNRHLGGILVAQKGTPIINRQPFQVNSLGNTQGGVNFTGPATPAEPNEIGWKETVMMFPGTVTRVIVR